MAKYLTVKQKRILEFIADYMNRFGFSPSIRDIKESLEIRNIRGVTVHLDSLENKGYISKGRSHRSIQILRMPEHPEDNGSSHIPILGTIAAGLPLLAIENIEGQIQLPELMMGIDESAFLLRVRGDSMTGAHILPDDLVLIRPQQTANNGDLVAALLGDEATVKRLHIEDNRITLVPANPLYEPIIMRDSDARIIGKVIGLLRSY
ncbi:MAG: transcriptional repressor LexA [Armatimonadota bacterium]